MIDILKHGITISTSITKIIIKHHHYHQNHHRNKNKNNNNNNDNNNNNNNNLLTDPLGGSSLLNYINYNYKIIN